MGYGDGGDPHEQLESAIREHLAKAPKQVPAQPSAAELCGRIVEHVTAGRDVHIHINVYGSAPARTAARRPIVRPLNARAMKR